MPILVLGSSGTIAEVDGTTFRALRVCNRPVDYGALGFYAISLQTQTVAAGLAANAEIFQVRTGFSQQVFTCVYQLEASAGDAGGGIFVAGFAKLEAVLVSGWTADGTGGVLFVMASQSQAVRGGMATSQLQGATGSIRVATTAALGAGTKLLHAQGIGASLTGVVSSAGRARPLVNHAALFSATSHNQNLPIVLGTMEGLVVRATVPATGTWTGGVSMKWAELTAF